MCEVFLHSLYEAVLCAAGNLFPFLKYLLRDCYVYSVWLQCSYMDISHLCVGASLISSN